MRPLTAIRDATLLLFALAVLTLVLTGLGLF